MPRSFYRTLLCIVPFALTETETVAGQAPTRTQRAQFWGFAGPWDTASSNTIRNHGGKLAAAITGWITLDSATGQPLLPSPYPDTTNPRTGTPDRMAIITTWQGEGFHPEPIRRLGEDAGGLARAAGAIGRHAGEMRYAGLVLDFELLEGRDLPAFLRVARAIGDSARSHGVRIIAIAIPATDTVGYPGRTLLTVADALIPMLYDQHWSGSEPGPIAEPEWVRQALALRIAEVGPARIVAGLPTYGYRWRKGRPTESIGYIEAREMAKSDRGSLQRDPRTRFLRSRGGRDSEIWVSDAQLLAILVNQSRAVGVHRFAIWRLGQEDPEIWRSVIR